MKGLQEKNGILLFGLIAAILLACAILAFQVSGPQGIEDRFSSALGTSPGEHGEERGGSAGFSLEGNVLLYIVIVVALAFACAILYRKYRV